MMRIGRNVLFAGILAVLVAVPGATAGAPAIFAGSQELEIGGPAAYAVAVDLDLDGVTDVLRTGADAHGLTALVNRGDATFDARTTVLEGYRIVQPPAFGDLDGDGDPDVVVGAVVMGEEKYEILSKHLFVLTNDGAGNLTPELRPEALDPWDPISVIDLDGDGDREIAFCGPTGEDGSQSVILLENDGAGLFSPATPIPVSAADGFFDGIGGQAVFGDLGNGLPVLLVQLRVSGSKVFRNLGDLGFAEPITLGPRDGNSAFGDVTGDGHPDIVTNFRGTIGVRRGTGDGWVSDDSSHGEGTGYTRGYNTALCITDLDGDGNGDVVAESFPGVVSIFRSRGDGTFDPRHEIHLGPGDDSDMPWIGTGNFDGDGNEEVFVHSPEHAWIFTPGWSAPPLVTAVSPDRSEGDEVLDFTLTGEGFTPETTVWFGEANPVLALRYESADRLVATVRVAPWAYDSHRLAPYGRFDVVVQQGTGVSTRVFEGLNVPQYWNIDIITPHGRAKDSPKPGKDSLKMKSYVSKDQVERIFAKGGEEVLLGVGAKDAMHYVRIPADDPGLKFKFDGDQVTKMTWRSPKGTLPKIRLDLRLNSHYRFKISVKGADFPGPLSEYIRVEFIRADCRAAALKEWEDRGNGRFTRKDGRH